MAAAVRKAERDHDEHDGDHHGLQQLGRTNAVRPIAVHGTGSAMTPNSVAACASDFHGDELAGQDEPPNRWHLPARARQQRTDTKEETSVARIRTATASDAGRMMAIFPPAGSPMLATASSHASAAPDREGPSQRLESVMAPSSLGFTVR